MPILHYADFLLKSLHFEDFSPTSQVYHFEDFSKKEEPSLIQRYETKLGDISGLSQKEITKRKREIQKQYKTEKQKRVLNQFLRNMLGSATLGLSNKTRLKPSKPEGVAEKIAAQVGHFTGFFTTPIAIGKIAGKGASRIISKVLGEKAGGSGIGKLIQYGARTPATLATANVVEDITNISEAPERGISGALTGFIFGGTALVHIGKSRVLSQMARQFGGRALLTVAGQYDVRGWTKENWTDMIFGELVKSYFLGKGIRIKDALMGQLTPKEWKEIERIQKEIDVINKKIPRPYVDAKPEKIPDIIKIISKLKGDKLTDDAINLVREAKHFKYNAKTKEKSIVPPIEDKPIAKPNELIFSQKKPDTFILDSFGKEVGKLSEKVFNAEVKKGLKFINKVRKFPTQQIDEVTEGFIQKSLTLRKDLPSHDLETFYGIFKEIPVSTTGKKVPRWVDMRPVGQVLEQLRVAKPGEAPAILGRRWGAYNQIPLYDDKMQGKWNRPDLQELHNKETDGQNKSRYRVISNLRNKIKEGKLEGTPLLQLYRLPFLRRFQDSRKVLQYYERITGFPWAKVGEKVNFGEHNVEKLHTVLLKELIDAGFGKTEIKDWRQLENYYDSRYDPKRTEIPKTELPKKLQEYIGIIDRLETKISPLVKKYRFKAWMRSYENVQAGRRTKTLPIFKNQKEIEPILKKIADKYYEQGFDVDPQKLRQVQETWLNNELKKYDFGIIKDGNYLPGIFTGRQNAELTSKDYIEFIDFLGTGHTRSRETPALKKYALEDTLLDEFIGRPLPSRISNHVKQMLNLEFLDEPLRTLDSLISSQGRHIERAYPKGLLRTQPDPKAMKFTDFLKLFAHRAKGYPVKTGELGRVGKVVQSGFFRALVVNPRLWLRNVFQRIVTPPDKRILNPKWAKKFKNLPEEAQDYFWLHISQFKSFDKHFLFLEETEALKKIKLVGDYIRFAEWVGKVYPLSDLSNRMSVTTRTFNRSRWHINQYYGKKLTGEQLNKKLAINKLDGVERLQMLELIDSNNTNQASIFHGKWMSDNSQWIYKRGEKSFWEMTGEGESFSNLFTWAKGMTQHLLEVGARFNEGLERNDPKMVRSATSQILGLSLMAGTANQILKNLTTKHGSKYTDYGPDMFMWEVGGVSFDLMKQFFEVTADIARAAPGLGGTPEDKKRALDNFARFLDHGVVRQMLPHAKSALSIVESLTGRDYISPFYEIINKRSLKHILESPQIQRNFLERLTHGIFATDPNKSKAMYKFVTEQFAKYKSLYNREENPIRKTYYYGLYKHYERYSKLLDRYQPKELYEYLMKKQKQEFEKMQKEEYRWKLEAEARRKREQEKRGQQ